MVNVVFSSLDGYLRMYLLNYMFMGRSILNLGLCFIVVPEVSSSRTSLFESSSK